MPTPSQATVESIRGAVVEASHPFSAVLWGPDAVVGRVGPPIRTPWRSAAKPWQLEASLLALAPVDRDAILADSRWLAIATASHSGTDAHVALVQALGQRFGVTVADLRCGAHRPMDVESADALLRRGESFSCLHNNCSGKHTMMVAASRALGADADYLPESHPLQRRISKLIADVCAETPETSIDGCGVPTFTVSLAAMARAYQRLAIAMADAPTSVRGRIGLAMARHPDLVAGEGRLDVDLVRRATEPIAAKIGALGVFCIALPQRRLGLAVKVHSGVTEALPTAVVAALHALTPGVLPDALLDWKHDEIRNVAGRLVGSYRARDVGRLTPGVRRGQSA